MWKLGRCSMAYINSITWKLGRWSMTYIKSVRWKLGRCSMTYINSVTWKLGRCSMTYINGVTWNILEKFLYPDPSSWSQVIVHQFNWYWLILLKKLHQWCNVNYVFKMFFFVKASYKLHNIIYIIYMCVHFFFHSFMYRIS